MGTAGLLDCERYDQSDNCPQNQSGKQVVERRSRIAQQQLIQASQVCSPSDYSAEWKLAHQGHTRSYQKSNDATHQDAGNNKSLFHPILKSRQGPLRWVEL